MDKPVTPTASDWEKHRASMDAASKRYSHLENTLNETEETSRILSEAYQQLFFHTYDANQDNSVLCRFGVICLKHVAIEMSRTLAAHDAAMEYEPHGK